MALENGLGSPTVRDVAALAGVSAGTVSKAINGSGTLSQHTRDKVLAAAAELGFRPNQNARALSSGRTYTVGVVTTDSFGRFTIPVLLGIEDKLGAGRLGTILCDGRADPVREQHYVQQLLERRVDGIVITGRRRDSRPSLGPLPVPVVYVLACSEDEGDMSVSYDDAQGAMLAVNHLIDIGRRNIAYVTGPERHLSARLRRTGVAQAMQEAGLELPGERVLYGQWAEAWGRAAVTQLLRRDPAIDGIFCGSDQIARGVADGLRAIDKIIPEDVAIVGFDNWDVMVDGSRPALTTIDPKLTHLGRQAASRLLTAIDGGELGSGMVLQPCELILRQSTL